jgi:hypothetical protein
MTKTMISAQKERVGEQPATTTSHAARSNREVKNYALGCGVLTEEPRVTRPWRGWRISQGSIALQVNSDKQKVLKVR